MSMFTRLYRGETEIDFVASRRKWYVTSAIVIAICLFSIAFRGFNLSIDFKGGSTFSIPATSSSVTADSVVKAFDKAGVAPQGAPQFAGSGSSRTVNVNTATQAALQLPAISNSVEKSLGLPNNSVSPTSIGSDWGHETTTNALEGLIIFLIVVSIYVSLRYAWRMAVGAMVALLHDLVVAAGIYSLVGFELTPSTIVGLLTILGFSLYDTVVVFDKVAENSKDVLAGSRMTYTDAANKAVNQTLMRSINTSLIALLPVAGLLFVGAGILGVGTIEDLALILFVGLLSGAYSSLFLATPVVVELTEHEPQYKALTKRVVAKRSTEAKRAAEAELTGVAPVAQRSSGPAPAPKVGVRPDRKRKR